MVAARTGITPRVSKATRLQGAYYLLGGLWPLMHYRSFEDVTGPKPDRFVTEVASALYVAIGTSLLAAGQRPAKEVRLLAVLTAVASAGFDVRHRPAVRPVYVAEAALEGLLLAASVREWVNEPEMETD
jgi:hypothetical protein